MISYAQNFEDVLLYRCFGRLSDGFYVDIGAYHPVIASVTKVFYDAGWSGINVEPGAGIDALRHDRPRDINLAAAVTDAEGEVDFWQHTDDPGTSTLQADVVQAVAERAGERVRRRVPTLSLAGLLEQHAAGKHIHFLKIDAEGAEDAIISGGNWSKYRPEVLVIESTEPYTNRRLNARWQDLLKKARYSFAYFDGINDFWVRDESAALLKFFEVPVNVLDGYRVYDPELMNLHNALVAAQETLAKTQGELSEAQQALTRRAEENEALETQLAELHHEVATAQAAGKLADSELKKAKEELASAYHTAIDLRAAHAAVQEELASAYHTAIDLRAAHAAVQEELLQAMEDKVALQASLAESQRDLRVVQAQAEAAEDDRRTAEQQADAAQRAAADLEEWRQRLFDKLKAKDAPRELRLVLPLARATRFVVQRGERVSAELKQPEARSGKQRLIYTIGKSLSHAKKRAEHLALSGARAALVPVTVQLARRAPKLFRKIRRDVRRKMGDYEVKGAENALMSQEVEDALLTLLLHGNQTFTEHPMSTRLANK